MNKVEGVGWVGGNQWIMVNDNDFSISADVTEIATVKMQLQ